MPGYDCDRFVNLSLADRAELTCSICQDIFCCPVIAQCCLQTFCEDCINNWLSTNNTCPYDRKTLTSATLSRPPRVMVNMLGKLKIKCDFRDKGCKEVISLEDLSNHVIKCRYNVQKEIKKCKKCFCEIQKTGHDCIKALLELNRKANGEIETLKRKPQPSAVPLRAPAPPVPTVTPTRPTSLLTTSSVLSASLREQSLLREIRELKAEKENFLKTIQDLTNSQELTTRISALPPINQRVAAITVNSQSVLPEMSEQEIFNECRKHLWSHEVMQNEMNKEMTQKVLSIVRSQIKEYNSVFLVCKNIVESLNDEFGHRWHCSADYKMGLKSYFMFESGFLIKVKFGLLFFEIYKTQFLNVQTMRKRFKNGKIKREIQILKTDMKQSMISDVKKITFAAIEKSETLTALSSEIKTHMEKRYPERKWQCFMFGYFGVFGIHHTCGSFISFDVGQLTVTLFQASND
ncbi:uncharacterized protein LOC128952157 isoform X2 [Oppia nitens]|uniref:uncharacterized protein LOC128952157 isoform X2 n=1 Tax=Oppia nitens TaxID=1686743 RepID=UPI0023DC0FEE|nr:uncharacterized protein LOC128952157 isoform X2 [Oppia nitens]